MILLFTINANPKGKNQKKDATKLSPITFASDVPNVTDSNLKFRRETLSLKSSTIAQVAGQPSQSIQSQMGGYAQVTANPSRIQNPSMQSFTQSFQPVQYTTQTPYQYMPQQLVTTTNCLQNTAQQLTQQTTIAMPTQETNPSQTSSRNKVSIRKSSDSSNKIVEARAVSSECGSSIDGSESKIGIPQKTFLTTKVCTTSILLCRIAHFL